MQATDRESRAAREQLRRRAAEIRAEQLEEALATLETSEGTSGGQPEQTEAGLAPAQREIVEAMSAAIVDGILAPVEADLEQSPTDRELAETVVSLFDLEEEP